ncbi:MAG TPA: M3 family oligoendopeptidase [Bacteroidia bacterium]|nr:M3 family oligoendopeptidase [Bacteroidia bacterium]HNU34403.1 M3 family oligoendopeptidase [Bacteroidia bacterium]
MDSLAIAAPQRKFVAADLKITSWSDIEGYFKELNSRQISSEDDLLKWLADRSELESVIQEDLGWRYIHMTCDTTNKEYAAEFNVFVSDIEPKIAPENNKLNLKLLACSFTENLKTSAYKNYLQSVKMQVDLFREENIPLIAELQQKQQQYGVIAGAQTVVVDGKEITMQQAGVYLKSPDRSKREQVYFLTSERRLKDKEKLDELFAELVVIRHRIAVNAGFKNYRDYMFAAMCRFDYTVQDCENFHASIKDEILPVCNQMDVLRKKELGYEVLKPWDMDVDVSGKPSLKPFSNADDLVAKTINCFNTIDPELAECIQLLKSLNRLDLDSRVGKAPGGYNYPLYETGVPFIFMNSSGLLRDLVTMLHEGGHAVHSVLTHKLGFMEFKSTPSEVAELASMSMELFTMEHWNIFFDDADDLKRAKREHLESLLEILPWIALVDKFQHWIYLNTGCTADERNKKFAELFAEFGSTVIDRTGLGSITENTWKKQLHIFEVPFYYIEYGMAQLGAIALWKNYKNNPLKTIAQYKAALSLGYTKSIPEIYAAAGIKFDFSKENIKSLAQFVQGELNSL